MSITLPYTMHCPKCKGPIEVTKQEMIGTRGPCPHCQVRIDILTPDEDGNVPYIMRDEPNPHAEAAKRGPSEEEIEAKRQEKLKRKKQEKIQKVRHWASVVWFTLLFIGIICIVIWREEVKFFFVGKGSKMGGPDVELDKRGTGS